MFSLFRKKSANRKVVATLYHGVAKAALRPEFFTDFGVADKLMGRFEILALHMAMVLRNLRDRPAPAEEIARDLTDYYFEQLDDVLRELGTSDNKVPKKMKAMAAAFLLQAKAYDKAFADEDAEAMQALLVERFGSQVDAAALARYVFMADKHIRDSSLERLMAGEGGFPIPARTGGVRS